MEADIFSKPAKLSFEGNVAENFRRFKQQLEIYMSATGLDAESVPKKKKVAIILNLAGEEAIEVHNSFTFTEAERDDPAALLAKFQQHCEPKKNVTYETQRHVFNTRSQQPAQPFDAFLTELRLQAKKCAYGTLTDELIRDRIVVGIRDDKVRSRLLREPELTLQTCIGIAHATETSQMQMQSIKDETNTVHQVMPSTSRDRREQRKPANCKYCGTAHAPRKEACPALGKTCSSCHTANHFARVCMFTQPISKTKQAKTTGISL